MPEHHPRLNHLLAALPPEVYTRLLPHLEYIDLPLGKVLYESGDALRHVYFPIDCIVSLLYVMKDGASAEISVVGNEGLIGVALFMEHHQPRPGTECGPCLPPERAVAEKRIQSARRHAAPGAALHPGALDPDGADGGVQSSPLHRSATLPLAAALPRQALGRQALHDPGADRQHAGGQAGGGDGCGEQVAKAGG